MSFTSRPGRKIPTDRRYPTDSETDMPAASVSARHHRSIRVPLIGGVVATPLLRILWAVQALTRSDFVHRSTR